MHWGIDDANDRRKICTTNPLKNKGEEPMSRQPAKVVKRKPLKETEHGALWPDAMLLRNHVGEAKEDGGDTFILSTSATSCAPIVTNARTGRTFTFTWEALIKLPREAGIDE
jgi:hypothetical protein